jgi:hypothetical protein
MGVEPSFPLRFLLTSHPIGMSKVLGIVYRVIASYLIKKSGLTRKNARTGAVTFIQRFGSALNLNIHFHMLFLDGVYVDDKKSGQRFLPLTKHQASDMTLLAHKISLRLARYLERAGLIEQDLENSYLTEDAGDTNGMSEHRVYSIHYRISIGPQKGKKVFLLKTLPPQVEELPGEVLGKVSGFSLHAGVSCKAHQRDKLERLCRYISRPAVSAKE